MVSREHSCIFVHIPRCAGSSVEAVVWPGARTEEDLWMGFVDEYHNRHQTGGLQHLLARQIREEVGARTFESMFKFTVVRNPFDRTVSQFAYMRRRRDLRAFIGMDQGSTFAEYLRLIRQRQHVQWLPQCRFVYDGDDLLVDRIVRFEKLESSLPWVFERLGLRVASLPHRNASDRDSYRTYYTAATRREVESIYQEDLRRFDYSF